MLSVDENEVMTVVFDKCFERGSCLVTVEEIQALVKRKLKTETVKRIIYSLQSDGYFDIIETEKRGEKLYCLTLSGKGRGFIREKQQTKRDVWYRIILAVVCGIITFTVGRILVSIFS